MSEFLPGHEIACTSGERYQIISANDAEKEYTLQTRFGYVTKMPFSTAHAFFWLAGYPAPGEYPDYQPPNPSSCIHQWQTYVGFKDTFQFCEKCDEKRPIE